MNFVGARLQLGRVSRGLSLRDLSEKVGSSAASLSHFERNRREPSREHVAAFAEVLSFQESFFFKPLSDCFTEKECSFRKRARTPQKVKDRLLAQGTLIADLIREVQQSIRFPPANVPRIPANGIAEATAAADEARRYWRFSDGPISSMSRVLERAGVVVVKLHDERDDVDAFSRTGDQLFVVLNEAKGSTSRSRMDAAHELGHLVMHDGQTSDREEDESKAFAGAFLLPENGFRRHYRSFSRVDWPELLELKRHWGVALSALIYRARDLGLMSHAEALRRFKYLSYRGWTKEEPLEPASEEPELLRTAVETLVARTPTSLDQLLDRLGWTASTFAALTGIAHEAVDAPSDVIPLGRAHLSVV